MSNLLIERHATHWTVTLNRPAQRNALDSGVIEDLLRVFEGAEEARPSLIVLQGEGPCFSAGFDMTDLRTQSDGDLVLRFIRIETLLNQIATSKAFTLAFAHGRNFGAGVDLFAACNMRVVEPATTFCMPGLKFGLVLGTARFARIVGTREGRRILESATAFDAERAKSNSFAERIADRHERAQIISETLIRIHVLPPASRALLGSALATGDADVDLAALVRSASIPGLRDRIEAYLSTTRMAKLAGM